MFEALQLMAEKSIGALVVTEGEQGSESSLNATTRESHPYGTVVKRDARARHHDVVGDVRAP